MKKFFLYIFYTLLLSLVIGCENREVVEKLKSDLITTGGVTDYEETQTIHGCIVITNTPCHDLWRTVVKHSDRPNLYHAGWSSKPMPIGSKVTMIPVQVNNFSGDQMRRITFIASQE